jgi:CheY-like chemotaxis protein
MPAPGQAFRVLVVDDVAELRLLVRMLLEDEPNLELLDAADGAEAVQMVDAGPVDLVIMDMHMPGMDGLAATREIRGRDAPPEIVAFTSSIDGRLSEAFMDEGAAAHFDKGEMSSLIAYVRAAARHTSGRHAS